jgi:starch synthase (maltosyl-transferring)
VHVPIEKYGISRDEEYRVEDLITGEVYVWRGSKNYVELNPEKEPAHLLRIIK